MHEPADLRAEKRLLTAQYNAAVANGLIGKARRFKRQMRAVQRKLDSAVVKLLANHPCVCGHSRHTDQCHCGCGQYERDNGTDESPTHTGYCFHANTPKYKGKYGGKYTL